MRTLVKLAVLAVAGSLTLGSAVNARELRVAPAAPPAHPANGVLYTNFAKYLPEESQGRLTGKILGPEVVNLSQMKDALRSRITEVGNLLPLYFPADLPNMALAGELSLLGTSPQGTAAAVTEFVVTCEPCQREMRRFGVVFLGSGASDGYEIMTSKPVRKAEDLKGLRLRSGGAPWARMAQHYGATPVQMSVFDQFEAMNQGVIDGTMASIADLLSFRLIETVKYITFLPIGLYQSTSNFATATATWDSLSVEDRAAMARAANRANTDFTHRWGTEMEKEAEAAAKAKGIEMIQPDAAFVASFNSFAKTEPETVAALSAKNFGIQDSGERIKRFLALTEKWTAIAESVKSDPKQMAIKLQEEVWSKVDYSKYGM